MKRRPATLGKLLILLATIIWGSSFVVLKNTLDTIPTEFLLGFRFFLAAVLLSAVFYQMWREFNLSYLRRGLLLGLLLFGAYYSQTLGLTDTTPGKNAFLTATYCAIVPFLYWAVDKLRPDRYNISAALLCLLGIGMVAITSGFSMRLGDSLTLVGAMFYAAHIVALAKFTRGHNPLLLTTVQFFTCGIINWILQLFVVKQPVPELTAANISALLYLTILCSAVALTFQSYGQKYTEPATAAILLSLESVFGVIFSIIFYHEAITLRMYCGFGLIFLAVIISETKLSFLKPRQQLVSLKKIP
ncbi:MAG: DMT family transporter [Peptococcaceae bacterium]|nr:DMT family transporter [Peptococcaceae bacterium]